MSYLIFCSLEVSGLPYEMAEVLNKHGVETYYISIARGARGHDSTLYQLGYRPPVSWDLSSQVSPLPWGKKVEKLRSLQQRYRFQGIVATGDLSYLLAEAGLPYLYWCFGVDLDQLDYRRSWTAPLPWWRRWMVLAYFFLAVRRRMIRTLQGASRFMIVPYQRRILESVVSSPKYFFFPHILAGPDGSDLQEARRQAGLRLRERFPATSIVFSAVRHFWHGSRAGLLEDKANQVAIEAFAIYVRRSGDRRARFITVSAGPDVPASQALASRLGIADQMVWVPHTSRQKLADFYLGADLALGNFALPLISFAVLEPLSLGCPCISKVRPYHGVATYDPPPPLLHADSSALAADFLLEGLSEPEVLQKWSASSRRWAAVYLSEENFVRQFSKLAFA